MEFIPPTWSEVRHMLKFWGIQIIARDAVDFFLKIINEKHITEEQLDAKLYPLVQECRKYGEKIGQIRLTIESVYSVIKQDFPEFSDSYFVNSSSQT